MTHSSSSRLNVHESMEVNLDGNIIPYHLKRSPRARHVRLEVKTETGLTIIVPQTYPISLIPGIIADKKRWVTTKLDLFRLGKQAYSRDDRYARYLGRNLKVSARVSDSSACGAILSGDDLILNQEADDDNRKGIEIWLKNQAEIIIKEMAERHSLKIGVQYRALRIRSAHTRWGSCSPSGAISFNWKLIMLPAPVIEYVVIHELCHMREMNHSKSFWKLVESHYPEWRSQRKWLKANEAALTL